MLPPCRRRAMGEDAFTQQLEAPRSGTPSCASRAIWPAVRRPRGGGTERALKGLCGGGLALSLIHI
eukprot:11243199-Alexandrium_andersonii.AAC.1